MYRLLLASSASMLRMLWRERRISTRLCSVAHFWLSLFCSIRLCGARLLFQSLTHVRTSLVRLTLSAFSNHSLRLLSQWTLELARIALFARRRPFPLVAATAALIPFVRTGRFASLAPSTSSLLQLPQAIVFARHVQFALGVSSRHLPVLGPRIETAQRGEHLVLMERPSSPRLLQLPMIEFARHAPTVHHRNSSRPLAIRWPILDVRTGLFAPLGLSTKFLQALLPAIVCVLLASTVQVSRIDSEAVDVLEL